MDVTFGNERTSDALVAVYLAGASEAISLHGISLVTDVPLSDLYGALRRHWKTIPRGVRPTKMCSRCREERVVADFGADRSRRDGLSHNCKTCERIRNRNRRGGGRVGRGDTSENQRHHDGP